MRRTFREPVVTGLKVVRDGPFVHESVQVVLDSTAGQPNLDAAAAYLRLHTAPALWRVTQGGHHVALSMRTMHDWVRVAMIEEVRA